MPKNRLLAKREVATYAQVLLDYAQQKGNVFEVSAQLEEVKKTVVGHPGLHDALRDGSIDEAVRKNILAEVFNGFDPAIVDVVAVMCERKDADLLNRFIERYNEMAEEACNVVFVDVVTAVELDDALRETIKKKFAAQFGKDIALRETVDSSILGGIILSAHGKRIDNSVSTKLDTVREALATAKSGGER